MDVRDLGALALTLAVAGIIISFTLLVQQQLGEEMCPTGSAYLTLSAPQDNATVHTKTSLNEGCCTTGRGNASICHAWTSSAAFNASWDAEEGVAEFSEWFVIIALALVFAIILGVIVKYIGGAGGRE